MAAAVTGLIDLGNTTRETAELIAQTEPRSGASARAAPTEAALAEAENGDQGDIAAARPSTRRGRADDGQNVLTFDYDDAAAALDQQ